ncbi:MAG: TnpV protein [Oscillospiraceae bacterium]|nr:TnpV protein [Oscillospiraceae bacterium]
MKEITYTMREDGLMYPDLTISEKKIELGPFAMKRKSFLQQHRRSLFALLVMKGQLTEHLAEIEQRAIDMLEKLTEQMAQTMGVTEQLKAQDQMAWVQQMNSIRHSASEIVNEQVIYS